LKAIQISNEKAKKAEAIYDKDVKDFTAALADVDEMMKIIANSLGGFLETDARKQVHSKFLSAVDNAQSDAVRFMKTRLTLAASFLENDSDSDATEMSVDKLRQLLLDIRNEMYEEMDKLAKIEEQRKKMHELFLRRTQSFIYIMYYRYYQCINRHVHYTATIIHYKRCWAKKTLEARKLNKQKDRIMVEKDFLRAECNAEAPLYHKQRDQKLAEIKTIEAMIKVLRNLNWSGAVYNAVSRITASAADANPEPGFTFKFEMDVVDGLSLNAYRYASAEKPTDFKRVAIKMTIGSSWVWVSFDAFDPDFKRYLIPSERRAIVTQQYVTNMVIKKSPSARVGEGSSAKGNLEIWRDAYHPRNGYKIPGASDGAYDFGDVRKPLSTTKYGCFQVHDYMRKQTVLAANNFKNKGKHDVGIGSQRSTKITDQPDWTYSNNVQKYKDRAEPVTLEWYFQSKKYAPKVATSSPTPKAASGF
jgi:hypothetical protein